MTRSNNAEVFDENSAPRPGDGPTDNTRKSKPNRVRLRLARRALDNAKEYLGRGWQPVPVPLEEKAPKQKDWQNLAITPANAADYFEQNQNIGLQLGARSGGLTDVDIDCREALALADTFLPATSAIFGRASKPRSHWLYITDLHRSEKKAVIRFVEPPSPRNGQQASTLIELRVGGDQKGAQTLAPDSIHPSGECVCWDSDGQPTTVDGSVLGKAVAQMAVAALLVRNYPSPGNRHEAALVLGGVLARNGATAEEIKRFVSTVAQHAGDEEADERGRSAASAVDLLVRGDPTPGLPRMREVWGVEVANTAAKWLELSGRDVSADEIDRLARLDALPYEQQRKTAAGQLGVRESILDKLVERRRIEVQAANSTDFLSPVSPWPTPVNGTDLVKDLCSVFKRHIVLSDSSTLACALWTLHAHVHDAATHSPILDIGSPTKRCGKTQLLATLALLVSKPLQAANVTPATVFRAINRWCPTMLIDEVDTFLADKSELRGVLNSGHTKSSAFVLRCVGDAMEPTPFSTWCPKVFAHIGRVHPTLEDRSIRIQLRRKLKTETVERIPRGDPYADLRRKCARFAVDNLEYLSKAKPTIPAGLNNDRAADNWMPLLAIAEICGCGNEARKAALELSGVDDDETDSIVLLADLNAMFERATQGEAATVSMSSAAMTVELAGMEDKKWPEFKGGKPITPTQIAALLKPFGITPRKVQSDDGAKRQVQGYRFDQFEWTFKRYLG